MELSGVISSSDPPQPSTPPPAEPATPDPVPDSSERAVEIAEGGGLAWAKRISVRTVTGEKFPRIIGYELGPVPEPVPAEDYGDFDNEDIFF